MKKQLRGLLLIFLGVIILFPQVITAQIAKLIIAFSLILMGIKSFFGYKPKREKYINRDHL